VTPVILKSTLTRALSQILDLFAEDRWRNLYAGELEVRPPGAPTIGGIPRHHE
jgi:hypothetical protein